MKRLPFLFLLISSLAFGQGVFIPPQTALKAVNGLAMPIANATITVCPAAAGGVPCSPALVNAIFQDAALSIPLSNPFSTDANGNYGFAIAPGTYTISVTASGFAGQSYQVTAGGGSGLTNPMTTLGDLIAGAAGGAPTRLPGPTSPNGVPQTILEVPSGGLATAEYWSAAGVVPRLASCPSNADTIAATDRAGLVLWNDSSTCTANLAQAGSTGFASNFVFLGCDQGAGTVNITPATSTISYANGASYVSAAASMPVTTGQCAFVYSDNANYYGLLTGSKGNFPSGAQIGDIMRWNVKGDSAWDAVNAAPAIEEIYATNQTASLNIFGPWISTVGAGVGVTGSSTTVAPTATMNAGNNVSAPATASTSTVIGFNYGSNGNVSLMGMEAFYRWSFRFSIGNTTNVRYWMGLACYNSTGAGNNALGITGTTAYAADIPNKSTIGFRFSAGTDTHWQAVAAVAGGSQTTVDTGVTPDTSVHLFEMTTNSTGTSVFYFIDGTLVATISTNLPPPASNGDSWGSRFFTGDNKNTATAISLTFYSMVTALKF